MQACPREEIWLFSSSRCTLGGLWHVFFVISISSVVTRSCRPVSWFWISSWIGNRCLGVVEMWFDSSVLEECGFVGFFSLA
jgi:hypothetical protein